MKSETRLLAFFVLVALGGAMPAAEPPSKSVPIRAVVPDLNRLQKWNDMHGDTADPFWADDDNLYHFTCDGRGFGKEKRNFCFNKLTGPDLLHLTGTLVNSMDEYGKSDETGPDGATWKVAGQEAIDGVFYAFAVRNRYGHKSGDPQLRQTSFNASLIASRDRGVTWTRSAKENYDRPMWPGSRFGAPSFIHYGKNGGQVTRDNADQYAYALSNNGFWNNGDDFIVGRVRRADLPRLNAADWRYYSGGDGSAAESWTADLTQAKPVLNRPAKLGWTSPVFIPALNRYLLVSWYVTPVLKSWFTPELVVYDFFEAEHPWGPWSFVSSFDDRFLPKGQHMYGPNLIAKYQEWDGENVEISLFTSGCTFQDTPAGLYKMWRIPLTVKTKPAPATKLVNDNDPAIRYRGRWRYGTTRDYLPESQLNDYQDDIHYTNQSGDTAEYTFNGTGVEVLCEKFKDLGTLEVYVDGQHHGEISLKVENFPRLARIPVFRVQGLTPGPHTIRVVNAGAEYIALDGFVVSTGPAAKP